MKVRFKKDTSASQNGITVNTYAAGDEIEVNDEAFLEVLKGTGNVVIIGDEALDTQGEPEEKRETAEDTKAKTRSKKAK